MSALQLAVGLPVSLLALTALLGVIMYAAEKRRNAAYRNYLRRKVGVKLPEEAP